MMTKHLDRSRLRVIESRDQGKQRGLPGAVQTEQRGESRLWNSQADILQGLSRSVRVADAVNGKRRYFVGYADARPISESVGAHFGDTTTPQGSRPTGIDFTTSSEPTSITEMSLDSPFVVNRYF